MADFDVEPLDDLLEAKRGRMQLPDSATEVVDHFL